MAKENIKSKKGFTIIEVVLVLAIAGLIFLMVFVALPALQRSQRDTQRRQDYADLSAAIASYMTNNNGKLPSEGQSLDTTQYINKEGKDPNGVEYVLTVQEASADNTETNAPIIEGEANQGKVYVYTGANCDGKNSKGNAAPKVDSRSKAYAIYGYLESGSYCQSSN